jgi:glutathione S-transferase
MKLLGMSRSPFVRKVRIFAIEKGIDVEYVLDKPLDPGSRIAKLNPLAKMPVLVLDDGEAVYDSVVIVDCLEGIKPEPQLIPSEFRGRIAVKRWEALGDGIAEAAINLSHQYGPMYDVEKRAAWTPRQEAKIERALSAIERGIAGREWLHGESLTLADIAAGNAIAYVDAELPGFDRKKRFPGLAGYADRLLARLSFRGICE